MALWGKSTPHRGRGKCKCSETGVVGNLERQQAVERSGERGRRWDQKSNGSYTIQCFGGLCNTSGFYLEWERKPQKVLSRGKDFNQCIFYKNHCLLCWEETSGAREKAGRIVGCYCNISRGEGALESWEEVRIWMYFEDLQMIRCKCETKRGVKAAWILGGG